jgi:hypothetical protein
MKENEEDLWEKKKTETDIQSWLLVVMPKEEEERQRAYNQG